MLARINKERWVLIAAIVLSIIASSAPYVIADWLQPSDRQFMGIVSNVPDWAQYMAWMKAFADNLIIKNTLTPEPQQPAFFNLQWFVMGQMVRWLKLPGVLVIQAFRISASVAFMLLTFRLCKTYFRDQPWARWTAWLLINYSAGFGWVWVVIKQLTGVMEYPLDVYVAEPISFQNMIIYPHFLFAVVLMLATFECALKAIERQSLKFSLLSGLTGLILGLTHAYDLIIIYAVLGLFTLSLLARDGFQRFPAANLVVIFVLSFPPAGYFLFLTNTDPIWREVLAQFRNAGVFTPNILHLIILIGLPLILAAVTFDGFFPYSKHSNWGQLLRIWFLVNLPLAYIPTDFQIHMLSGWQVPISILASEGIFLRLLPILQKGLFAQRLFHRWTARLNPNQMRWGIALVLVLAVLPTNLYLLVWRVREVAQLDHTHYLYVDELQALNWLEGNTHPSDTVLASLTLGQYVPALAGNTVYLGHWAQTVDFYNKQSQVTEFFQINTSDNARRALLNQFNIRYILYGRAERELGELDPSVLPYLELVFEATHTRIYRVSETN